jgi:hypothetical protein
MFPIYYILKKCMRKEKILETGTKCLRKDVHKCFIYPPGFRISDYKHKNTILKINILSTPSFFYAFPPLPYLLHPSYLYLHSIFLHVPFSPSLSFRYIKCAQLSLSPRSTFCTFFPLLPSSTCFLSSFLHLNLAITFFSFALFLPRYSGISSVIHLSYFLLCLDSLVLSLLPCLSVFLSLSFSSTFIHLPFAINLSTSSLPYPFL